MKGRRFHWKRRAPFDHASNPRRFWITAGRSNSLELIDHDHPEMRYPLMTVAEGKAQAREIVKAEKQGP